ncbi:MAG: hypothetical protein QOH97_4572 [Actinoplanes sp.]|nr:hypothetical protein [Actinoplanes sp.]
MSVCTERQPAAADDGLAAADDAPAGAGRKRTPEAGTA